MKKLLGAVFLAATFFATPSLASGIEAKIDLSEQTMYVYQNGFLMHRWKVSTARSGYRTPTGSYRPQRMYKKYFSRKYDNAPMPYSIFFHGGYAIHGTNHLKALGRPASHGCVRLHPENAAQLYSMVQRAGSGNTRIKIVR
ncbi:MAG: L,D-transpeptidase [Nitratireductor sp.]|nr:L,D-transpeptidase [Nitratireductor sp.]